MLGPCPIMQPACLVIEDGVYLLATLHFLMVPGLSSWVSMPSAAVSQWGASYAWNQLAPSG